MSKGMFVCVICGDMDYGYGNNPAPLSALPRKCCDVCNTIHVIPARIALMMKRPKKERVQEIKDIVNGKKYDPAKDGEPAQEWGSRWQSWLAFCEEEE